MIHVFAFAVTVALVPLAVMLFAGYPLVCQMREISRDVYAFDRRRNRYGLTAVYVVGTSVAVSLALPGLVGLLMRYLGWALPLYGVLSLGSLAWRAAAAVLFIVICAQCLCDIRTDFIEERPRGTGRRLWGDVLWVCFTACLVLALALAAPVVLGVL